VAICSGPILISCANCSCISGGMFASEAKAGPGGIARGGPGGPGGG
jgi:hypothetical protein